MKTLRHALWLFLIAFLGCGQQLVEVPLGSAPTVTFTDPVDGAVGVPVGTVVQAVFSTTMDAATLSAATFTLTADGAPVLASVSYAGKTATLTPEAALATDTLFTARVTTGARDEDGISLAADHVWSFTTRAPFVDEAPTVIFTSPEDGATAVPLNAKLGAAFSEPMDSATLDTASFTLSEGATPVPGVVSYLGTTVTFTPTNPLTPAAVFTATIGATATDLSGTPLAADHVWTFTTGTGADVTAPTVLFTSPVNDAVDVPLTTTVQVAFDEPMDCTTLDGTSVTLTQAGAPVLATLTCFGTSVTLAPTAPLAPQTLYTGTVTTGAQDLAGNALAADYVWTFTTGADADLTPPVVVFTNPADNANGVAIGAPVQAAFDGPVDCVTLDITTFTLMQGVSPVLGTVTCLGAAVTFTPSSPLLENSGYTARLTTGVEDLAGNALANDYVWSFLTGQLSGLAPVDLGLASSYAILAFNTVTNVNNVGTIVTGDLGISPGAALVGFPPGVVVGATHLGDATAAAAKAAVLTAYNDAAGRLGAAVLPGDLSGLTLAPGLYANATSVMIAAGNLTLDAQGNVDAVFIFQVGSTLTTLGGTQVILAGGAKATNVYWAIGTSATLGTNSIFKGTLIAASALTMTTGAVLEGRLLAQGAAVALDTNLITVPGP